MRADPPLTKFLDQRINRNTLFLLFLVILSMLYSAWLSNFGFITASSRLDGTLGILLGLNICFQPAAYMLDILLFMKADAREKITTSCGGRAWLSFVLLAGIAAWEVIFTGVPRLFRDCLDYFPIKTGRTWAHPVQYHWVRA